MALHESLVEALFARLLTAYGTEFERRYAELDPAAVKASWAQTLDGIPREAIAKALDRLPADRPPNAMQFRRLCIDCIQHETHRVFRALPAPVAKQTPGLRERLAAARQKLLEKSLGTSA